MSPTAHTQHIDAVRQCAVLSLEAQHKGLDGSGDADGPEVLGHFAAVGVVHDSHEGVVVQCKPGDVRCGGGASTMRGQVVCGGRAKPHHAVHNMIE